MYINVYIKYICHRGKVSLIRVYYGKDKKKSPTRVSRRLRPIYTLYAHTYTPFLSFEVELYTLHADDAMCDNSPIKPDNVEKDFEDIRSYRFLDCRVDQ